MLIFKFDMEPIGFVNNGKKTGFLEDIVQNQKYVVLYTRGRSEAFSGKATFFTSDGYIILNPFTGLEWDSHFGMTRKLVYEDIGIRINDIMIVEPIGYDNLKNFIEYQNKQNQKE